MTVVKLSGFAEVDHQLARLPLEVRGKALAAAMKAAAQVIVSRAKMLVPPPGYPGDKPGLRSLKSSIKAVGKVARRGNYTEAQVRAHGQHAHLVEGAYYKDGKWINIDVKHHSRGKPTGTVLKKHPFIQTAEEQTKFQQSAAIREGIKAAVKKATGQ